MKIKLNVRKGRAQRETYISENPSLSVLGPRYYLICYKGYEHSHEKLSKGAYTSKIDDFHALMAKIGIGPLKDKETLKERWAKHFENVVNRDGVAGKDIEENE